MNNYNLQINFNCGNYNCIYCGYKNCSNTKISFDQIKKLVEKIPKDSSISLSGGEPTLREDFLEICELCKDHILHIQTTGEGLDENICKQLSEYNCSISLNFNSFNKLIYTKIANCSENSYYHALSTIINIAKYNIKFSCNTVINKLNINDIYYTFLLIKLINNSSRLNLIYPLLNNNSINYACTFSELKPILNNLCLNFQSLLLIGFPLCVIPDYKKHIRENNSYCLFTKDQIRNNKIINKDLLYDSNLDFVSDKNNKIFIDICNQCVYKNNCEKLDVLYLNKFGTKEFNSITK